MRVPILNVLRNCKFKTWCFHLPRTISATNCRFEEVDVVKDKQSAKLGTIEPVKTLEDLELEPIEVASSWPLNTDKELRQKTIESMLVIPNFVSEREEQSLMIEIEPVLKRMRYEYDHWDNAIEGYRETERAIWTETNERVIARMKAEAFPPIGTKWLKSTHVLDLAPAGYIRPHVDAVRFCGDIIVGLCLLSSAVMRLRHTTYKQYVLDALLPQRGVYIMKGVARYEFEHEVLPIKTSLFRGVVVPRRRRVAIITRTEPKKENTA